MGMNILENKISELIHTLKIRGETQQPSAFFLKEHFPELLIKINALALLNPYATQLFLKYFDSACQQDKELLPHIVSHYPAFNTEMSKLVSNSIGVDYRNIFVGNGAIEIIQAVIHEYAGKKVLMPAPIFAPFHKYVKPGVTVVYHKLIEEDGYRLDMKSFIETAKHENVDMAILVNPNNPDGNLIKRSDMEYFLSEVKNLNAVIIDESFIQFSSKGDYRTASVQDLINKYPNLIVIKSLSKDYGVAGLRVGYGIMSEGKVRSFLQNGYLWNVSGLAEFFLRLLVNKKFKEEYEQLRIKYLEEIEVFLKKLSSLDRLKVYSTSCNFILCKVLDERLNAEDVFLKMLVQHGIYIRDCSNWIGLSDRHIRLSCRTKQENQQIYDALKAVLYETEI